MPKEHQFNLLLLIKVPVSIQKSEQPSLCVVSVSILSLFLSFFQLDYIPFRQCGIFVLHFSITIDIFSNKSIPYYIQRTEIKAYFFNYFFPLVEKQSQREITIYVRSSRVFLLLYYIIIKSFIKYCQVKTCTLIMCKSKDINYSCITPKTSLFPMR